MSITFTEVSFTYQTLTRRQRARLVADSARGANAQATTQAAAQTATQAASRNSTPAVPSVTASPSAQTSSPNPPSEQQWGETPDTPWALQNISFSIEKGEFIGLAGHTGSGKSTLLQHMNGLLAPTCGTVSVDGFSSHNKKHKKEIIKRVGLSLIHI